MEFRFRMSQDVRKADAPELMLLKVNVKKLYGQKAAEKPSHSYNLFFSGHTDPV